MPAEEARAWAAQIPHAQMKVIQGAGHVSNLEQADKFNALVRDFLAGPAAQAILGTSLA